MTRVFSTGATRDSDSGKLDIEGFLSPRVLRRYCEFMHACRLKNIPPGQEIRSADNWQHGIPKDVYMGSLLRHIFELWQSWREQGVVDQDAACAALFNLMGLLFEELK